MYNCWVAHCRTQPLESSPISRKGEQVLGPSRRVRCTRAALRQATIREMKGPSLNRIQVTLLHQRSPYAVKFEDRSPGETERQERCARGDAWKFAKKIYKLKEMDKSTFFSPANEWCLPAASTIRRRGEFVVDSGASMHMVSRKDLNPAELETAKVFKNPTTVVTANCEVLTKEEATVCVQELDFFVTVVLLEDTSAVLSLGKLCEDHWKNYHWTSGQKPHLIKNGRKIDCNTANYVPFVVPGLSTSSSSSSSPTSPTSSSQETMTPTEHPASTRSESIRKYEETRRMICQNGLKSSRRILWMTVSQNTATLPVLLMNTFRAASKSGIG